MKKLSVLLIIATSLFILSSCGGGGGGGGYDAPAEGVMTISYEEASVSFLDTAPLTCNNVATFLIVVKDKASGIPLNNVALNIFYPFAQPYNNVVQLYDGDPAGGGTPENAPMTVSTDKNGAYTLFIAYCGGGGIEYSGDIQVTSGPLFKAVTFSVTAEAAT